MEEVQLYTWCHICNSMQPPAELSKSMANKKNKWKNACRGKQLRGKYKRSSKPDEGKPNSGSAIGGCRIVNMDQLQKFVAQVSSHSRSCKNGSISLTSERYREGLASVLSAPVVAAAGGCIPHLVQGDGPWGGVSGGSATWQPSGGRCQPVEVTRHSLRRCPCWGCR